MCVDTYSGFSSPPPVNPESCCLAANMPRPLVREFHIVLDSKGQGNEKEARDNDRRSGGSYGGS